MTLSQPLSPPPGFEQLTKTQQINYVQQLWDLIVTTDDELPIPQWHLEIVNERVASQSNSSLSTWEEVKQRLLSKYSER
ncbi:addiction module protein [Phormidesmis sp. 146-12]